MRCRPLYLQCHEIGSFFMGSDDFMLVSNLTVASNNADTRQVSYTKV